MHKYISEQKLILASSSPRRRELLQEQGLDFQVISPDCDESLIAGEPVKQMVLRLSLEKAKAVAEKYPSNWIIGADTTVFIDNKILGKPGDTDEAVEMLSQISGKWHEVWGGLALINQEKNIFHNYAYCTKVLMRKLTPNQIKNFVASGEPMDKAGAYAIQGVGAGLVAEVQGSYTNVVGLNVCAVIELLSSENLID